MNDGGLSRAQTVTITTDEGIVRLAEDLVKKKRARTKKLFTKAQRLARNA